jgi:putative hemin transport protein
MLSTTMERADGPGVLAGRWRQFRAENPKIRIRDAARALGTSEAALVATGCGETAIRLRPDWAELLKALPQLGRVMALTRNESCVHERHGRYDDVSVTGIMGLVLGPDIDLRIFLSSWKHAFAVIERTAQGDRRSVQVFDAAGVAVHKVYATTETDGDAFTALIERFRAEEQSPSIVLDAEPAPKPPLPDGDIDVAALRDTWSKLEDTHDFFGMLRRLRVDRLQAFRLAGPDFAKPLAVTAARSVLEKASARELPIMIFVGNRGCIQIHTGPVKHLVTTGPWLNVLDPDFNLHLREDAIVGAWLVRKPTRDGDVTSVEIFNAAGDAIAMFFGKRKPGQPEGLAWRALANDLAGSV